MYYFVENLVLNRVIEPSLRDHSREKVRGTTESKASKQPVVGTTRIQSKIGNHGIKVIYARKLKRSACE